MTELRGAYALVRRFGEEALVLLRRGGGIHSVRTALIAHERDGQRREAREMSREDDVVMYTPYIPDLHLQRNVCVVGQLQKNVVSTCVAAVALETTVSDITDLNFL